MPNLSSQPQQPQPLVRGHDDPVAREPVLEDLDLRFEEPDLGVTPRRPALHQQDQKRINPVGRGHGTRCSGPVPQVYFCKFRRRWDVAPVTEYPSEMCVWI
jgi:hypothetical protein